MYDQPYQFEPLLPGAAQQEPLLAEAHDLARAATQLAGLPVAPELRGLLRGMNSYYTNRIEGQHKSLRSAASISCGRVERWAGFYGEVRRGEAALLALAAAHQRLGWIHPFIDSNGRVILRSRLAQTSNVMHSGI